MAKHHFMLAVDGQFGQDYPELYRIIEGKLREQGREPGPDIRAGKSSGGNLKILLPGGSMIVVPKSELREGKVARELLNISGVTKQANADKNAWRAEVAEMIHSLEPFDEASAKIREKLEKPEWPFTLAVIKQGKERRLVLHSEECQDDKASIVLQTDRLRPCVGNLPLLRSVLMEAAERLADRVHEIKKHRSQELRESFLKSQKSILRKEIAKCTLSELKELSKGYEGMQVKVTRASGDVTAVVSYQGMDFQCRVFSETGMPEVTAYQDLKDVKCIATKLTTIKNPAALDDPFTANTEKYLLKELAGRNQALSDALKAAAFAMTSEPENDDAKLLREREKEYRTWLIPWIDGNPCLKKKEVRCTFRFSDGYPVMENATGSIAFQASGAKLTDSEGYWHFKECEKSRLQDRCRNYAREAFAAYDSVECEKGCAGILYGDTTLTIKKGRVTLWGYQFKTPPFQVSVPAWKKNLEKHVKAIDAELNRLAEEEERKFRTRYQIFFDSLLARDILEFIIANEHYITANAVAQAMRGTAIALDTAIKKTDGCGRYRLVDADEIKGMVKILTRLTFLQPVSLKGTYGTFEILKVSAVLSTDLDRLRETTKAADAAWSGKEEEIRKKIRENKEMTDPEAEWYLINVILRADTSDVPAFTDLTSILSNTVVTARHEEEIRDCAKRMPDIVRQFVKIRRSQSEDMTEKKRLKLLLP